MAQDRTHVDIWVHNRVSSRDARIAAHNRDGHSWSFAASGLIEYSRGHVPNRQPRGVGIQRRVTATGSVELTGQSLPGKHSA